ncbi:MAG TPA: hypothetical protein VFM60_05430 [Salinimicrobium sp.]|nr:hypothetical protein [Salinimicrobium sp.]
MNSKLKYIKGILLAGLVFFLFSFAENRNSNRKILEVELAFTNAGNLYITEGAVNKLLIQNNVTPKSLGKETLDLNKVESLLNSHEMIENAEVFLSLTGTLGAVITQRKPIARVLGESMYYIDRQGLRMPLSDFHSARVPLVRGVRAEHFQEIFPLLKYIAESEFLSRQIVGIERSPEGLYALETRGFDFVILLGKVTDLEKKFNNFRAFYQQAMKDKKLDTYSKVNLRFGNQVVCTKE